MCRAEMRRADISNQPVYDWRQAATAQRHHFLGGWSLIREERLTALERENERLKFGGEKKDFMLDVDLLPCCFGQNCS